MVGLPSAPLRCITYNSFSDVDKASFASENLFWVSVFEFLSVYRRIFPRSFRYVLFLSDLPDTADKIIQQTLRKVMKLMSYVYLTVCNLQDFLESG